MESTKRGKEQTTTEEANKDKNLSGEGNGKGFSANQGHAGQASQHSQGIGSTEKIDQAKQVVTDAYNRTSKTLNETYSQAIDYGREHPAQLLLDPGPSNSDAANARNGSLRNFHQTTSPWGPDTTLRYALCAAHLFPAALFSG